MNKTTKTDRKKTELAALFRTGDNSKRAVAYRIKVMRRSMNTPHVPMTAAMFGKLLGINSGKVSHMERGNSFPPVLVVGAMRELLGVSYDFVYEGLYDALSRDLIDQLAEAARHQPPDPSESEDDAEDDQEDTAG